jgi:hypothetical protein
MFKSFDDLWNACEELHKQSNPDAPISTLLSELSLKTSLYKTIAAKTEMSEEECQKAKSRILGEILLTLTHISLKDNINVFESLSEAWQFRNQK